MKICIPDKKLGRLKQKKNQILFLGWKCALKNVRCYNCSFQRSPGRNFRKAQFPNYKNVLTQS